MSIVKITGGATENSFDFAYPQDKSSLLINGYVDVHGNTIKVPGKKVFVDFTDTIKAAFTNNSYPIDGIYFWRSVNKLIIVSGPPISKKLFSVDMDSPSASPVLLSMVGIVISSNNPPVFAEGYWSGTSRLFVASGGKLVTVSSSLVVTYFDNTNYVGMNPPEQVSHVGVLDGYVLMNKVGTQNIYVTTDPTNPLTIASMTNCYFACEYRPDNVLAFVIYNREIVVFGGQSTELWYNDGVTGSATTPSFSRNNAGCFDIGITSPSAYSIILGTLFFMDTLQQVRKIENRTPTIISDEFQKYLADIKTQDMKMCAGFVEGKPCLFLIFPSADRTNASGLTSTTPKGVTLCYDIKLSEWAFWGEYKSTNLENELYGESYGERKGISTRSSFPGFKLTRDKINCSTLIAPSLSSDSQQVQKVSSSISNAGSGSNWDAVSANTWDSTTKTKLSSLSITPYFYSAIATVASQDGTTFKMYVFGGDINATGDTSSTFKSEIYKYDSTSNTWVALTSGYGTPFDYGFAYAYCVSAYDFNLNQVVILIYGGVIQDATVNHTRSVSNRLYRYYPWSDMNYKIESSESTFNPPNLAGGSAVVAVILDSKLGYQSWMIILEGGGWLYNVQTRQWSGPYGISLDELQYTNTRPLQRVLYGAVYANRNIYVFGGLTALDANYPWHPCGTPVDSCKVLNLDSLRWTNLPAMSTAVYGFSILHHAGRIYCFGGFTAATGNATKIVQIYDIATKTWTSGTDMPTICGGFSGGQASFISSPIDTTVSHASSTGIYIPNGSKTVHPTPAVYTDFLDTNYRYIL